MREKQTMKKIVSLILSCAICMSTMMVAGCGDSGENSSNGSTPPITVVESLELNKTELFLTLGDKETLTASYSGAESKTPTWSSSAPTVASVDENGTIEALESGKTTITVACGSMKASCEVEVSLSGNVPTIAFESGVAEKITLLKESEYDLGAYVSFNGKAFYDGEIEYFVSDENVGTVTDGIFTSKAITGSTQVSVWATWRGQSVRVKTITIDVIAESTVLLNEGKLTTFDLYTVTEHEGVNYLTSKTISSVFVSEDGTEVKDYSLAILDESIASIEKSGETWTVASKKAGKTNLVVSYGEKEFFFDILVSRPVFDLNGRVDYSVAHQQYFDEASETFKPIEEIVEGFENLVSYQWNGKEYKLKNGTLSLPIGESHEITFYNEYVGYKTTVYTYTEIFDELQDFEKIYAGEKTTDINGYYMLGKDILEPDTVLTMPEGKKANNFAGVFDGRGHVLSFTFKHVYPHRYGLFGDFLKGATIKNLALYNITKNATAGANPAGIICGEGSDGSASTPNSTIENVFVDLKFNETGASNLAFMGNAMWATSLKNVIVHVPEVPVTDTYGSFARGEVASTSNSYVISSAPLYKTVNPTTFRVVPLLYESYTALLEAELDYTSFSAEYWDVATFGVPVWKSLVDVWQMD